MHFTHLCPADTTGSSYTSHVIKSHKCKLFMYYKERKNCKMFQNEEIRPRKENKHKVILAFTSSILMLSLG